MMRVCLALAIGSASALKASPSQVMANLVAGQKMFDKTQLANSAPEQAELSAALQAAAGTGIGSTGGAGSSVGAASFLNADELSKLVNSIDDKTSFTQAPKVSMDEMAQLANQVMRSAQGRAHSGRASAKCGHCSSGINFGSCPSGFSSVSGQCAPEAGYSGYCNKQLDLGSFSAVELEEMEVFCDFCFACA